MAEDAVWAEGADHRWFLLGEDRRDPAYQLVEGHLSAQVQTGS
jgi:hypothetical protein